MSRKFSFELKHPCKNTCKFLHEIATEKNNKNQTFSYADLPIAKIS